MSETILDKIITSKRRRVEEAMRGTDINALSKSAFERRKIAQPNLLVSALRQRSVNIIAEFKRASPSKGVINDRIDAADVARMYAKGGACAISVLTEEDHFQGSIGDLRNVRECTELPILRKDFVIDDYQIVESAAAGADAILLIVSVLAPDTLRRFQKLANDFGLDAIFEVHDIEELEIAIDAGTGIIGVNNRNLKTFEVSLDTSREVIKCAPKNVVLISESGIYTSEQIAELRCLGYSGFLIGESLMRSVDPVKTLNELTSCYVDLVELTLAQ